MASEGAINVPQLVVLGVLGYLAFRWIYSSPSSSASTSNPPGSGASSLNSRARGARPSGLRSSGDPSQTVSPTVLTAMNQVLDIFPDTDRRDLAWALSRNPRNAQTVLNQLAEARPLPRAPDHFNPALPAPPPPAPSEPTAPASSSTSTKSYSLIQAYDLGPAARKQDQGIDPVTSSGLSDVQQVLLQSRQRLLEKRAKEGEKRNPLARTANTAAVTAGSVRS